MIRIPKSNEIPKVEKSHVVHSLDQLVESLGAAYAIPSSRVDKMKSGLENVLCEYLSGFLSDSNNFKSDEDEVIRLDRSTDTDRIVECIRLNETVILCENQSDLVRFTNSPEGIKYQFEGLDASTIPSDLLIESWNCQSVDEMVPLINYILSRKEL